MDEEFNFYPSRWGIIDTSLDNLVPLTLAEAYNNHLMLQGTLDTVKSMGATIF